MVASNSPLAGTLIFFLTKFPRDLIIEAVIRDHLSKLNGSGDLEQTRFRVTAVRRQITAVEVKSQQISRRGDSCDSPRK
jgi:hypothetical protein